MSKWIYIGSLIFLLWFLAKWFTHLEEMNCLIINQTGGYCERSNE